MCNFQATALRRSVICLLCVCLLMGLCWPFAAQGEENRDTAAEMPTGERQVLICLAEALPENEPYVTDDRKYERNIAVPAMTGVTGYLYRKTTQSNYWLFPVSYAQGTPVLYLSLKNIKNPTSVTVNNILLSAERPVAVPLKDEAELRVANAKARGLIRLSFTVLPVIQIRNEGNTYKDVEKTCTVTVTDPDWHAHGKTGAVMTYEGLISRRGGSSSRFGTKHPYNITLNKDGKKYDESLLGLRSDSDWLLDSAYIDRSRMRNRVLMDVWHDVYRLPWDQTLSGATKGVYVELIMGEKYYGLYVLGEKQDRQQLGLAKPGGKWNSSFFRTGETGSNKASPAGFVSLGRYKPGKEDPRQWYNVELRYPHDDDIDYSGFWNDYYEFTRFVVNGTKEEFAGHIADYADLDNLARYWLFANAVDLTDNMRKNMSFVRLDDRDERFNRYILVPWDMDASLGRLYSSQKSYVRQIISNRLFDRLIEENPLGFLDTLYSLWQTLKDGPLSTEGIMGHFEYYFDQISGCGADRREMGKYPTFRSKVAAQNSYKLDFDNELAYIRTYTEEHIAWLDTKIEELCRPEAGE